MKNSTLSEIAGTLVLGLSLSACGGGDDAMNAGPDAGDDTADAASTAPTVMVSPSEGERGVRIDQPIVLTFSKPMSTASVEAAWTSASLPAAEMEFSWNAAGTILTVDASAVLEYPAGGLNVDRFGYAIELDASAVADDGEPIANPVNVQFETARDISVQLPATLTVVDRSGSFNGVGAITVLRVGDDGDNASWRSFFTFELDTLPAGDEVVEWTSASVYARQASVSGTPYAQLGAITIGHVSPITAIDASAYTTTADHVVTFSDSDTVGNPAGDRTADVLDAIEEDHAAARAESTLRLEFGTAHDLGNDDDYAIFEAPRLDLRFLAE